MKVEKPDLSRQQKNFNLLARHSLTMPKRKAATGDAKQSSKKTKKSTESTVTSVIAKGKGLFTSEIINISITSYGF